MTPKSLALRVGVVCAVAALGAGVVLLGPTQTSEPEPPPPDPNARLPTSEQMAAHEANTAEYQRRSAQWLDAFIALGADPRDLERSAGQGYAIEAKPDLETAVRDAALIVEGVAERVEFEFRHMYVMTTVFFRVDAVARGDVSPGQTVTVLFLGGPHPSSSDFDPREAVLVYEPASPLLLPGDRAVLFLEEADDEPSWPGDYLPQSYTGVYPIEAGRIDALPGNPFRHTVTGETPQAFLTRIEAARE